MSKEIFIQGVGNVVITKKRGLRRMTLSVRPFCPVRLTIPYSLSYSSATSFINEKKEWIIRSKEKISNTENKRTVFNIDSEFKTKERHLKFEISKNYKNQIQITKSNIIVSYTDKNKIASEDMQDFIRHGITEALRIEAKNYLPERTSILAKNHGFKFNKIRVRNAKTRWGSCSGLNNISLNIQLMRLPDYLIDYVILHELCHTVEKNHGKNFWFLLDKISGNAKGLDKELKGFSPSMY
ncbi:MAG: M48 family metallopeptidase [Bacteroidales bacterium]|nr:M48 family metallopeptidase [Bacteroidales bacterium]